MNGLRNFGCGCLLSLLISTTLCGQHSTTPVLLVNGFQATCPDNGVLGTFGQLPTLLQQDGASVDFFDVCASPDASIEALAGLLASKIQSYPGPVDVVAHSMGGLVVRSYLQGRTNSPYLSPPGNTNIRKLVLLGTPNFGVSNTFAALSFLVPWASGQAAEMQFGSPFLWYLGTWNQLYDDLRGVDALAIAGTAGGSAGSVPWDGVVDVASASLDFADSSGLRTRVVPYCHASIVLGVTCPGGSGLIASVPNRSHLSYQLLRSFLDGTTSWELIAFQSSSVSTTGGLQLSVSDSNGNPYYSNQLASVRLGNYSLSNSVTSSPVWTVNDLPGGIASSLTFDLGTQGYSLSGITVPSGGFISLSVKFPPAMTFVTTSAGTPPGALSVAPGSLMSIYGAGLASGTVQASSASWPYQLVGTSLTLGGVQVQLQYASAQQINALVPALPAGLYVMLLTTPTGRHSINLMVDPIVPALFTLGNNVAAAQHAATGQLVTTSNPAVRGEYVSLFGTGLGSTFASNGLNMALRSPAVLIGGQNANVTFAGRAPGFVGLDQINVQIPAGIQPGAVVVQMTSGNRISNAVSLSVQ